LAAPVLTAPENGASFNGWNAKVILQWSSAGWMANDEYFVIRIPYDSAGGVAEFWRKESTFEVPPSFSSGKVGFADRHYNWSVQVMRCTALCDKIQDDNAKKQGVAVGDKSAEGMFYWHPDISGGGTSNGDSVPKTSTPPPP
jgi:hypothetical protein